MRAQNSFLNALLLVSAVCVSVMLFSGCSPLPTATLQPTSTPNPTSTPILSPSPSPTPLPDPELLPDTWKDGGIFSSSYEEAYALMRTLTLEEKVGQMIVARCPGASGVEVLQAYPLGGFTLFQADFNGKTPEQVRTAITSYQKASRIPLIIATDEEGGSVVRLSANPLLAKAPFLAPSALYKAGGLDRVLTDAEEKAALLLSFGINTNYAPVADVSMDRSDYIHGRTLGLSAVETADYVAAVVRATRPTGLSSTLKHFPGYGNNADTHKGAAVDERPFSSFVANDFLPFQSGIEAGVECIMVSHNLVKCMDVALPASLSPAVHRILRIRLGFTGVILTDSLGMGAITGADAPTQSPSVLAVLAGNDILVTPEYQKAYDSVLTAVLSGTISRETVDRAVFRILAWKYSKNLFKQP
jgi:beta-N-acetylhexosaminidase